MAPVLSSDGSERSRSGRQSAASSSSVRKGDAGGDARSSSRGKKEKAGFFFINSFSYHVTYRPSKKVRT